MSTDVPQKKPFWTNGKTYPYFSWRWPLHVAVWGGITLVVCSVVFSIWWFGGFSEFHQDAAVEIRNDHGREVFNMPDQFPNLTTVCIHGNRVIETTRSDNQFFQMYVVENAPECAS